MENLLIKINEITALIPDFAADAIIDSLKLIPWLFVIFVFIEIFESCHELSCIGKC